MMRRIVQESLRAIGYRLVPKDRDAFTLYETVRRIPFRTVVDVGANVGTTVVRWATDFPDAHIHAVEPLPSAFQELKKLEQQFPGRVSAWNFAASDHGGKETLFVHSEHPTSSSLLQRTDYCGNALPFTRVEVPQTVELATLDEFLADSSIELTAPILIKLDVQGTEEQVLRGATKLLAKAEMVISEVSLAPLYNGQSNLSAIIPFMLNNKYDFQGVLEQFHLPDGTAVYVDALFQKRI
jgi:FkbM family methyltransferase